MRSHTAGCICVILTNMCPPNDLPASLLACPRYMCSYNHTNRLTISPNIDVSKYIPHEYVCVYIYTQTFMYVHVYTYIYIIIITNLAIHGYAPLCICICICICIYTCTYVCTCMYVCMYVCVYVCMYVRTCVYIHIYIWKMQVCTCMCIYVIYVLSMCMVAHSTDSKTHGFFRTHASAYPCTLAFTAFYWQFWPLNPVELRDLSSRVSGCEGTRHTRRPESLSRWHEEPPPSTFRLWALL